MQYLSRTGREGFWEDAECLTAALKQELYGLIRLFDAVCSQHRIPYFVMGGTLLGSVRHREMIRWDYDVDVGVLEEHLGALDAVDWGRFGLRAESLTTGKGKIFYAGRLDSNENCKSVFVDVFGYARSGEYGARGEKRHLLFGAAREMWPTDFFYDQELFPLQRKYRFADMVLSGPAEHVGYCQRVYGDNWRVPQRV